MLIAPRGSGASEVTEITPIARFMRVLVALAVLMVIAGFWAQLAFHSLESATPADVDNLGARDFAWLITGIALLLALRARVWRTCPSINRERLIWCLRGSIATSALGVVLDILCDYFISFLLLGAGLGRLFAWAGFLAFCLSIAAVPPALLLSGGRSTDGAPKSLGMSRD